MSDRFPEFPLGERNALALSWAPAGATAVLDAGCSWGYGTRFLAGSAPRVAGIDADAESVAVAASRYPQIEFKAAPLEQIPFEDEEFDLVFCLDVFEHVEDERRSLDELFRVMKPGGTLILTTPHRGLFAFLDPQNLVRRIKRTADPVHRHYSLRELIARLDASDWGGRYEHIRHKRGALLLYPLTLWLGFLPRVPGFVTRAASAALEAEYKVSFGRAAYCVALQVRKAQ